MLKEKRNNVKIELFFTRIVVNLMQFNFSANVNVHVSREAEQGDCGMQIGGMMGETRRQRQRNDQLTKTI